MIAEERNESISQPKNTRSEFSVGKIFLKQILETITRQNESAKQYQKYLLSEAIKYGHESMTIPVTYIIIDSDSFFIDRFCFK